MGGFRNTVMSAEIRPGESAGQRQRFVGEPMQLRLPFGDARNQTIGRGQTHRQRCRPKDRAIGLACDIGPQSGRGGKDHRHRGAGKPFGDCEGNGRRRNHFN